MNNTINIGNTIIFKHNIASIIVHKMHESSIYKYIGTREYKKFNFRKFCYETIVSPCYFEDIFGENVTYDDIKNTENGQYYLGNNGTHPVIMCKPKLTIFMVGDAVPFNIFFETDEELDNFMKTEFGK